MTTNILLYKKMYFYYALSRIMTTNILLYMKMYFYYTSSRIMTTNIMWYISMHERVYNDNKYFCDTWNVYLSYETMYKRNICCHCVGCIMTINIMQCMKVYFHYTRRCITTTNIFLIHENVVLIIQGDV